jgi:hypothetical protein
MATFYSALLALGTGTGAAFVELTGSGYARAAVNFGTPSADGVSPCLSTASWTPGGTWPAATQLAIADASGAILIVLNLENAITFSPSVANTIAAARLTLALPHPVTTANLQGGGGGSAGEIGGSATTTRVALGADAVLLTSASVLANIAAGG